VPPFLSEPGRRTIAAAHSVVPAPVEIWVLTTSRPRNAASAETGALHVERGPHHILPAPPTSAAHRSAEPADDTRATYPSDVSIPFINGREWSVVTQVGGRGIGTIETGQ
jgi:hypothetical protein